MLLRFALRRPLLAGIYGGQSEISRAGDGNVFNRAAPVSYTHLLINHADRVKIACLAQLVNVIAPIFTEKNGRVIRQTIFYPFQYLSTYGRGMALKPVVVAPTAESRYGETPLLHSSVVFDEEKKQVNVFCLNLSDDEMELDLDMRSFGKLSMIEHLELSGPDLNAVNTFDQPDTVTMKAVENLSGSFEACKMVLPKYSWHVLRFQCEE